MQLLWEIPRTDREAEALALTNSADIVGDVDISNAGDRSGEEVVQLYVRSVEIRVPRPLKDPRGFARVLLEPGESTTVKFSFTPSAVEYYESTTGEWRVEPGRYELLVGASSTDIRQKTVITVP